VGGMCRGDKTKNPPKGLWLLDVLMPMKARLAYRETNPLNRIIGNKEGHVWTSARGHGCEEPATNEPYNDGCVEGPFVGGKKRRRNLVSFFFFFFFCCVFVGFFLFMLFFPFYYYSCGKIWHTVIIGIK
jgi:hypothetical protein